MGRTARALAGTSGRSCIASTRIQGGGGRRALSKRRKAHGLQQLQPFPTEFALVPMPDCPHVRPIENGWNRKCRGPRLVGRGPRGLSGGIGRRRGLALPGNVAGNPCMPCGFDSRLGHHQTAGARRGQGRPTPLSKRSCREPCQQSGKRSTCCRPICWRLTRPCSEATVHRSLGSCATCSRTAPDVTLLSLCCRALQPMLPGTALV